MSGRVLFTIRCTTCGVLLQVRSEAAIGELLICPKCGCLVKVEPPPGWPGPERAAPAGEPPADSEPKTAEKLEEKGETQATPGGTLRGGGPEVPAPPKTLMEQRAPGREETPLGKSFPEEVSAPPSVRIGSSDSSQRELAAARAKEVPSAPPSRIAIPVTDTERWDGDQPPRAVPLLNSGQEMPGRLPPGAGAVPESVQLPEVGRARSLPAWALWGLAAVPALVFALAGVLIWNFSRPTPPVPTPAVSPEGVGAPAQGESVGQVSDSDAGTIPRPWWWEKVPSQSRMVVYADFRVIPAPLVLSLVSQWSGEFGTQAGPESFSLLGIQPEALAETLWVRKEFAGDRPGFFLLRLLPKHTAEGLAFRGEPAGLSFWGISFRRQPGTSWSFPFGVLDSQTVLTGEPELLEALSRQKGPPASFESPVFDRLWKHVPPDAVAVGVVDLQYLRDSGWQEPTWAFDVWPEVAPAWQVLCRIPVGIVGFYRQDPTPLFQLGLLCSSPTAASQVAEACAALVDFSQKFLAKLSEEGQGSEFLLGEQGNPEGPQLGTFLLLAAGMVKGLAWEVVEDFVWLRLGVPAEVPRQSGNWKLWEENLRRWWLMAGLEVDFSRHAGLQSALEGYRAESGHFPPAAGGAALLPVETRLSWIALLLPQLGLEDWYRELQFGYSWNSPQNRPVTQRQLQAVVNPSLGPHRMVAGFPVTHYVGVAGVGPDAPHLPASDPRAGVFGYQRVVRLEDIPDGASNTLAILGVSGRLGPWAAGGPATVRPLTERPYINGPDGFGSGQPHGMLVGMADGSVRFISAEVDPVVLEQLAAMGDGAPKNLDFFTLPLAQSGGNPPAGLPAGASTSPSVEPLDGGIGNRPTTPSQSLPQSSQPAVANSAQGGGGGSAAPPGEGPLGTEAAGGAPTAQQDQAQLVAARLATEIRGVKVPRVPMVDAIRALSRLSNVPVSFDLEPMLALGISPTMTVEIEVGEGNFRQALERLVAQGGLTIVEDSGHVIITIPEEARTALVTKRYPVGDLLSARFLPGPHEGNAGAGSPGPDLGWLVRSFVAPETWKEQGGRGSLRLQGTDLEVEQPVWIHREVERFLENLRSLRQAGGSTGRHRSRWVLAQKELSRPITVNFFEPAPLGKILRQVEQSANVKLLVNWRVLTEGGITQEPEVTFTVHQLPLGQALEQLLLPLGLAYRVVEPTVFEVTTRSALNHGMEIGFYFVGDILRAIKGEFGQESAPEEILLQIISAEVGGESWAEAGGPARMVVDQTSEHLIVLQSQPVHAELDRYLSRLRAEFRGGSR